MAVSRSASRRAAAALHLQGESRVDDVRAGQSEVQEAALGPDGLGDLADEGDDVAVGRALQLLDASDVDAGSMFDDRDGVGRHLSAPRLGARDGQLDPQHGLEARLIRTRWPPSRPRCSAGSPGRPGRRRDRGRLGWRLDVGRRRAPTGVDRPGRDRQAADVSASLGAGEVDQRRGLLGRWLRLHPHRHPGRPRPGRGHRPSPGRRLDRGPRRHGRPARQEPGGQRHRGRRSPCR